MASRKEQGEAKRKRRCDGIRVTTGKRCSRTLTLARIHAGPPWLCVKCATIPPEYSSYYERYLEPGNWVDLREAAKAVGSLDEELKLTRHRARYYQSRILDDPEGGLVLSWDTVRIDGEEVKRPKRIRPWGILLMDTLDLIRRLEQSRVAIVQAMGGSQAGQGAIAALMDELQSETE